MGLTEEIHINNIGCMKFLFLIIILFFGILLGVFSSEIKNDEEKDSIKLQNPEGIIFPMSAFPMITREGSFEEWSPTMDDIHITENILEQCIQNQHPNIYKNLSEYKRQYYGLVDQNGQHIVGIYAFIGNDGLAPREEAPIMIIGGGDSVFSTSVNLDKNTCSELIINDIE